MSERRTSDELGLFLLSLLSAFSIPREEIRGAILSSVVPALDGLWEEALRRYLGLDCMRVGIDLDLGLPIRYGAPREVGADRLVNAVAGVARYGAPLVIVDLGTAITLDVVDPDGAYRGGAIAPGLVVSMESLFSRTAKLPQVSLVPPKSVIGGNTAEAIQSGIIFGYAGLIDSLAERIFDELGTRCPVVATGGHAAILADCSRTISAVEPWLTLEGLRTIFLRNAGGEGAMRLD
jgi:type III pantothenate kinase